MSLPQRLPTPEAWCCSPTTCARLRPARAWRCSCLSHAKRLVVGQPPRTAALAWRSWLREAQAVDEDGPSVSRESEARAVPHQVTEVANSYCAMERPRATLREGRLQAPSKFATTCCCAAKATTTLFESGACWGPVPAGNRAGHVRRQGRGQHRAPGTVNLVHWDRVPG